MTWPLALAGFLVGTLVGVTGMGGGSLMTPLLVLLFGFNPAVAIGTDIVHGAIFKSVGALQHRRMGNVQARLSGWMFLGSAPMSLLGVWLAWWLANHYGGGVESTMGRVLGGALLFGSVGLLAKSFIGSQSERDQPFILSRRDRVAAVLIGLLGGFVVGLTSVGSGVFFGLTLLLIFPLRARKVVGTDIFHAAALLYVAGFGHWLAGNVDFGAVAWLLLGSVPGVLLGGTLTLSVSERPLRIVIAVVLGLSGVKLIDPPGGSVILVILIAAGATAFLAYLGRRTWVHAHGPGRGRVPTPPVPPAR